MFCPNCGASNPSDARFCLSCAARLELAPEPAPAPTPVTGPTVRLDPPAQQPMSSGTPRHAGQRRRKHSNTNPGAAIFLIGLGILFLTKWFWPGILVLLGMMALINQGPRAGHNDGLQGLIFFGGLALLFATGLWWPGILLWLGAMALVGGPRHKRCGW